MIIGIDASRANVKEKTGTEWHSWHLIRQLAPRLQGHTMVLYTREPLEPALRNLGSHVQERVLSWRPGLLWTHLRLSWEMLWHPPDVLFVPADTIPIIHPRNTVTIIHDVAFERFPELYRGRSVQRQLGILRPLVHAAVRILTLGRYSASERDYHRWSARQAVRTSRSLVTITEFSKQEIVDLLGADPRRIVIAPPGIPQPEVFARWSDATMANTLRALHLDRRFFVYVGRLEKKKNIDLLLQAYTRYHHSTPNAADLVLAGSPGYGWDEAWKTVDTDTRRSIHVLHWQSNDVIHQLEKSARAMIFISRYEGFGIPPMESLSAGVPVLSSRFGSLPEVLGDAALFVDGDDPQAIARAMDRLDTDNELRARIVAAGASRVRVFTWERSGEIVASVLLQPQSLPSGD